jgi:hypothetical protein
LRGRVPLTTRGTGSRLHPGPAAAAQHSLVPWRARPRLCFPEAHLATARDDASLLPSSAAGGNCNWLGSRAPRGLRGGASSAIPQTWGPPARLLRPKRRTPCALATPTTGLAGRDMPLVQRVISPPLRVSRGHSSRAARTPIQGWAAAALWPCSMSTRRPAPFQPYRSQAVRTRQLHADPLAGTQSRPHCLALSAFRRFLAVLFSSKTVSYAGPLTPPLFLPPASPSVRVLLLLAAIARAVAETRSPLCVARACALWRLLRCGTSTALGCHGARLAHQRRP